jgi:hypothetical protein
MCYHNVMDTFSTDIEKQRTLQYSGNQELLLKTIASLSNEDMNSPKFKSIATERYLSSLRAGLIDNAEMTKFVFRLEPFFLNSKLVKDAALEGYMIQKDRGHNDIAEKIKKAMNL